MAACVVLPSDEFLSERYLDAFYEAHVASSRTRNSGALDEDIAAIEAEIRKVQGYRSKFRNYRLDYPHLSSCGNSECSDIDDTDVREDLSPTSVFRVYNSSVEPGDPTSPYLQQKTPDIFTWASAQQVQHDHSYYCQVDGHTYSSSADTPLTTIIDHGTVAIANIQWHKLTSSKRAHAVQKLSCILQRRPSGRHSPTFSSLDLLPASLINWIRKSNSLSVCVNSAPAPSHTPSLSAALPLSLPLQPTLVHVNKLLHTREMKLRGGGAKQDVGVAGKGLSLHSSRHSHLRKKSSPYPRLTRPVQVEVTRVRHVSNCSDGEDHVVID